MNDARTLDRPVQPTLQVRQIVAGQNYREHYDAKALADAVSPTIGSGPCP